MLTVLSGCATRPPALPEAYSDKLPWGAIDLDISKSGKFTLRSSLGSALIKKAKDHNDSNKAVPFNILTLSGGGTRGAFGAGLLSGWTDSGNIPEFDIVTGVSTGAVMLMAFRLTTVKGMSRLFTPALISDTTASTSVTPDLILTIMVLLTGS